MAKVADGKRNINANVREETVDRIERLKEITMITSTGTIVDLAVKKLMDELEGTSTALVITTNGNGKAIQGE